jgi:hypothetical protein
MDRVDELADERRVRVLEDLVLVEVDRHRGEHDRVLRRARGEDDGLLERVGDARAQRDLVRQLEAQLHVRVQDARLDLRAEHALDGEARRPLEFGAGELVLPKVVWHTLVFWLPSVRHGGDASTAATIGSM